MALIQLNYPDNVNPYRDARNGMYPCTSFYNRAITAENHIVAFRKKQVLFYSNSLGDLSQAPTGNVTSCHFHTGFGTTGLIAYAILGIEPEGSSNPYVELTLVTPGVGSANFSPQMHPGITAAVATNAPDQFTYHTSRIDCDPDTTYELYVSSYNACRIIGISVFEYGTGHVDDTIEHYNETTPQSGAKIYSSVRDRLYRGLSEMWARNGGLQVNWSLSDTTARTRQSTTPINLIDNTTTGTPTVNTPGWTLDLAYRTTATRAVVPCRLAVYGSISTGTGVVRVTDTSGNSPISVNVTNSLVTWHVGTGNLAADATKKYDPMFYSDGSHTVNIYAISLYEYE